jgi:hypothetical protein
MVTIVTFCIIYTRKGPPPNTFTYSASRSLCRMSHGSPVKLYIRTVLFVLNVRRPSKPFKAVELGLFVRIDQIIQHCRDYIILFDPLNFSTLRTDY